MVLKVAFDGFWSSFSYGNNLFIDILKHAYSSQQLLIVHEGSVDILFVSVFPRTSSFNPVLTVCFNGENKPLGEIPQCDLLLGYMPAGFNSKRFIELPLLLFLLYGSVGTDLYTLEQRIRLFSGIDSQDWETRLDKCIVLLSNPADQRLKYVEQLEKYFAVDKYGQAFGRVVPGGREGKMELLAKYRYHYCSENAFIHGYVTEKLFDSAAAGCVPIYNKTNLANLESVSLNMDAIYDESAFIDSHANQSFNPSSRLGLPVVAKIISKLELFDFVGNTIRNLHAVNSLNSADVYVCHYVPNTDRQSIITKQQVVLQNLPFHVISQSDASNSAVFENHLLHACSRFPFYMKHYEEVADVLSIHAQAVSRVGGSIKKDTSSTVPANLISSPRHISRSELSLNLKHRTALARFLMSSSSLCIVLEDDAIPISSTSSLIARLIEIAEGDTTRYLYVDIGGGCRLTYRDFDGVTSCDLLLGHKLYDVVYPSSRTTCAYLVNKKFAGYFLAQFPHPFGPIDFEYLFCLQAIYKQSSRELRNQWLDPPAFVHGSQEHFFSSSIQKSDV